MTGRHLKIEELGSNVQGVTLQGRKELPEHATFVVRFPGGHVEISRTSEGKYWAHVRVNHPEDSDAVVRRRFGRLERARLDIHGRSVSEADTGDFDNPGLYHLALLISPEENPGCVL